MCSERLNVDKPAILGIGAQKCASTWVYQVLSDHPQVFVSTPKELDFFSCFYDRGFHWYERHFAAGLGSKVCGEISPSYFVDSEAPARAKAYNPDYKVIVALRDPIERAYSNHLHDIRLEHLPLSNSGFEAGLENNPMYVDQGRYGTHLKRWLEYFPPEQILVLLQEEVKLDPDGQAKRVYEFLGVDSGHTSEFSAQKANESYLPKSKQQEKLFSQISGIMNKMGLEPLVEMIRSSKLFQWVKAGNRQDIRQLVAPMSETTRAKLTAEFEPEVLELARLLHRESLPWKIWSDLK